jgi:hypothetical protein
MFTLASACKLCLIHVKDTVALLSQVTTTPTAMRPFRLAGLLALAYAPVLRAAPNFYPSRDVVLIYPVDLANLGQQVTPDSW